MKIIDGKKIAETIKDGIAQEIFSLNGARPNLAIILANNRPDSKLYVTLKEKEAKKVGIDTHLYRLEDCVSENELLGVIDFLNADELIDGILVQLPLDKTFNTDKIIAAINPEKDADGFHPQHPSHIMSPVLAAILKIADDIKLDLAGKKVCVLYNSEVFGQSLQKLLSSKGAIVSIVPVGNFDSLDETASQKKYEDIKAVSTEADVLISALGLPKFIKSDLIKPEAVVIDVGITQVGDKVLGDVDFEDVKDKAGYITPVPGGIGPMTIALLFRNVLEIYKKKKALGK